MPAGQLNQARVDIDGIDVARRRREGPPPTSMPPPDPSTATRPRPVHNAYGRRYWSRRLFIEASPGGAAGVSLRIDRAVKLVEILVDAHRVDGRVVARASGPVEGSAPGSGCSISRIVTK